MTKKPTPTTPNALVPANPGDSFVLYTTEDGQANIRLRAEDGTVWLSQGQMAELFQTTKQNVSLHIQNVFAEGEFPEDAGVKNYLTPAPDGKEYLTKLYRLEVILAVGYRVRSVRGTQFRRWATSTLTEYLVKGFVMNDERLKEPGGWDYFDELLARIREIRASEKRFYQKVKEVFATSVDYTGSSETADLFFKTIQNKMLWAVTGQTAAELVVHRADPTKPNMNLMAFQGTKVRKADVTVAKNYLNETEARELERLVTAFLDLAEDRATRRLQTTMADWVGFVDSYLKLAERNVLQGPGKMSHTAMETIAHQRYEEFDASRKAAELAAAEAEHAKEVDAELQQLEKRLTAQAKGRKGAK